MIDLNDLAAVVRLIDVVTSRGAVRGDELTAVGNLRDKLAAFVNSAQQQQEADQADAPEVVDAAE